MCLSSVVVISSYDAAGASVAAILDRNNAGLAIAEMIRMIATTISNSIREKPRCLFIA